MNVNIEGEGEKYIPGIGNLVQEHQAEMQNQHYAEVARRIREEQGKILSEAAVKKKVIEIRKVRRGRENAGAPEKASRAKKNSPYMPP